MPFHGTKVSVWRGNIADRSPVPARIDPSVHSTSLPLYLPVYGNAWQRILIIKLFSYYEEKTFDKWNDLI